MEQEYLTLQEAADLLRVTQGTIRRYVKTGRLAAFRVAGLRELRFRRADVLALLEPVPAQ